MSTYSQINYNVMLDTKHQYETDPELQEAVYISKSRQYIVLHEENIDQPKADDSSTKYVVSGKRSFEAAKENVQVLILGAWGCGAFLFIVKRGCQLPLNYDEEMAIWWHMCEYEVSKDRFNDEYEESKNIALCRLIQQADGIAARTE